MQRPLKILANGVRWTDDQMSYPSDTDGQRRCPLNWYIHTAPKNLSVRWSNELSIGHQRCPVDSVMHTHRLTGQINSNMCTRPPKILADYVRSTRFDSVLLPHFHSVNLNVPGRKPFFIQTQTSIVVGRVTHGFVVTVLKRPQLPIATSQNFALELNAYNSWTY